MLGGMFSSCASAMCLRTVSEYWKRSPQMRQCHCSRAKSLSIAMPLQRGEVQRYDFDRMTVEFTMLNQGKVIMCAISTAAMDNIEGTRDVRPDQRIDQFMRLPDVI
jgi:hypothetical protein